MEYQVAGLSDAGLKRNNNQDAYLIDKKTSLFIVCDGVGGGAHGALASSMCVKIFKQEIEKRLDLIENYKKDSSLKNRKLIASLLQNAAVLANHEIYKTASQQDDLKGMATTLVSILLLEDFALITHVGDSRAYLQRAGKIHQLTEDHHFGLEMLSSGAWTEEQVKKSPHSNVLTRAVGMSPTLKVDTLQVEVLTGDQYILSTDGFYRYTEPKNLSDFLSHPPSLSVPKMIEFAKKSGGEDNITVISLMLQPKKVEEKKSAVNILEKTELLTQVPLFRFMNFNEISKILSIAEIVKFEMGETIVKEGDPSLHLFIIAKGKVDVLQQSKKITVREKGDVIGEMGVFDKAPRAATLKALESVYLIQIAQAELLTLFKKEQLISLKFIWALNGVLTNRLRKMTSEVATKNTAPVDQEITKTEWVPFS